MDSASPPVAVIILAWNQCDLTVSCLRSLLAVEYPACRLIVVDNGSADGTAQRLRVEFGSSIDLVTIERNLGFAEGNNVGIRHALAKGARYVMLLNNDTVVDKRFLGPLVDLLQSTPRAGAVTPKIYFLHDPDEIWAAGSQINWWTGSANNRGHKQHDQGQFDRAEAVDYGPGCCLLTSREVLDRVGPLDDSYFAYFEDADWCVRMRKAGFDIWYEPRSWIWHVGGASSRRGEHNPEGKTDPLVHYLIARNGLWLMRSHAPGLARIVGPMAFAVRHVLFYSIVFVLLRRWRKLRNLWWGAYDGSRRWALVGSRSSSRIRAGLDWFRR